MDNKSYNIRVPKRWARIAMIVGVTALIMAPLAAVATDAFTDVPNSHTHHNDITWLKDAAVTKGCNPPNNTNYCPDDNVTRGQMATFMRNLTKYIGAEDGTPAQADNADTLDGLEASQITSRATAQLTGTAFTTVTGPAVINTAQITAPTNGVLLISGSSYVFFTGLNQLVGLIVHVNGSPVDVSNGIVAVDWINDGSIATQANQLSYTVAAEVPAGTHTVEQLVSRIAGSDTIQAGDVSTRSRQLLVEFVPEGSVNIANIASTGDEGSETTGP